MIDRKFFVIITAEEESPTYKGIFMKMLLYLLLITALWYVYIFLRFLFRRAVLLRRVKRFVNEHNIAYSITASAFLLPSNRFGTALLLKTHAETYNIRLFGLIRANCAVHFWDKEMYSIEKYIPRMSLVEDVPLGHRPVRRRKLGKWSLHSDTEIPVLLYRSANSPIRVTQTKVNHVDRVIAGDMIEDVLFVDSDYLFRYIENRLK